MSGGIGPLEPGEGTEAQEDPRPGTRTPRRTGGRAGRWARRAREVHGSHRRAVLAAGALLCASAVVATGAALYAARPRPVAQTPPAPSQVFSLTYLDQVDPAPSGSAFVFTVRVRAAAGPPVTLERLSQPSRGLKVVVEPLLPAKVAAGETRDLLVRIEVTDCVHVARNSGLPFLEVTLSNKFQKEEHSYIPGDRYAGDLSVALTRACPEVRDTGTPTPS
ncbi:Tat pathway signal sequence domain protein [Streptomyces sp. ISL-66]|uniref:Tat pathway signal sequence domain protein n=1 Tax=Streptomyces sp. ISL-66 TaxID=2819186 RepID=UPI001BE7B8FF|nr:Tat pathway signal sequence domain protein [Streptomyces sp. ISL-66]MBT2470465.1 Tat pathway signal sequence domain protein [Streptomyces sp. ISL-66]